MQLSSTHFLRVNHVETCQDKSSRTESFGIFEQFIQEVLMDLETQAILFFDKNNFAFRLGIIALDFRMDA